MSAEQYIDSDGKRPILSDGADGFRQLNDADENCCCITTDQWYKAVRCACEGSAGDEFVYAPDHIVENAGPPGTIYYFKCGSLPPVCYEVSTNSDLVDPLPGVECPILGTLYTDCIDCCDSDDCPDDCLHCISVYAVELSNLKMRYENSDQSIFTDTITLETFIGTISWRWDEGQYCLWTDWFPVETLCYPISPYYGCSNDCCIQIRSVDSQYETFPSIIINHNDDCSKWILTVHLKMSTLHCADCPDYNDWFQTITIYYSKPCSGPLDCPIGDYTFDSYSSGSSGIYPVVIDGNVVHVS